MKTYQVRTPTYVLIIALLLVGLYFYGSKHHMFDQKPTVKSTSNKDSIITVSKSTDPTVHYEVSYDTLVDSSGDTIYNKIIQKIVK